MTHVRTVTLATIIGLVGCGGGGGSIPIDELADELVDSICGRFVRCGFVADLEVCRSLLQVDNDLIAAVENGSVDYDGGAARECLDAFGAASCDESSESARVEPAAYAEAVQGTVADGGACAASAQCISQDCAITNCGMACCPGTCATTVALAPIGSSCATADCVNGAYCDPGNTCRALLAADAACMGNDECGYGLYCDGFPSGVCRDAPNRGDACPQGYCADLGDICSQANTCIALSAAGGTCDGTTGAGCRIGLVCDMTTMACEDPPPIGQPCTSFCALGAFCDMGGTCAAVKPDGQMCMGDDECNSRYCNSFANPSVCAAPPICVM